MKGKNSILALATILIMVAVTACGGNGTSEEKTQAARESVKQQVAAISKDLPVSFKGGYTFQSVSVDEKSNVVRYLYRIDTAQVKYVNFLNEKKILEEQLRHSLSSSDEEIKKFVTQVDEAGLDFVYRYEFSDGNFLDIEIDPSENKEESN